MNFESAREIDRKRQQLKESRQHYLEKAKAKYEKEERKAELTKQREEDKWMLSGVNDRLEREQESLKKMKKKKKEKKKKKHKKKEKKKKKKDSSSSSDSSSDGDDEPQWIEKGAESKKTSASAVPLKGPRLERDSWMEAPIDLFPTVTRKDLMDKKNKEKEEMEKQKQLMDKPGMYAKELNPYWKDGGTGLPEEGTSKIKDADRGNKGPGDGGLSWLRKSYQRCVEQAKEEGCSLEELAAERWGSLEKIQQMIHDAEASYGVDRSRNRQSSQRKMFMKPGDSESRENSARPYKRTRSRSKSPSRNSYSGQNRNSSSTSDRYRDSRRDSRSRSRDRSRRSRSRDRKDRSSRSRSRDRCQRHSRSRSGDRKHRSRSRDRHKRSRSRERSRDDRRRSPNRNANDSGRSSLKGRFMKPGDMNESTTINQAKNVPKHAPAWKKKEFQKPVKEETSAKEAAIKDEARRRRRRHSSSSSESSSSDSSSEDSDSDSSKEEREELRSESKQEEVPILSEKEMNQLGAKILRAELMGNQEQAEKLKQQIEAAREAKKNAPAGSKVTDRKHKADEDEFVTLTRTDRSGLARPVLDSKHPVEAKGGRRRKKQKVETHTGQAGERSKYFDDDDKFDLKTMVEREKLGTAEDQNQMFARLAGRAAAEKTNDDFQVDDIFLSKADRKQSESIQEERDRAQAIFEHRKMAGALEKCNFCFNNVKKHLIIAIGTKAYLCMPETKSLTEGHCLIVPMQHVAAGTALDEDVWSEMQVFRKCLTKMFAERDEDVVFLETSMHLKHFPHMCLHCVPMEREVGELAPIYFKKAIQESGSEWSQNKKLVDLREKDVRHAIPKGFPYFAVDFGYQGGFAHVIEDEHKFPAYFGQEIIGGMIDADHKLWRKPPKENFDDQRKKVLQFSEMWKPYDWTQNIAKKTQSDSDSD